MAKETFYFSHDYYARKDPKCVALIQDFGAAGYGIYWCLIEIMYEQGGKIRKFRSLYSSLAKEFGIGIDEFTKQIEAMLHDYELLQEDAEFIWSDAVLARLEIREGKKGVRADAGRLGGLKSGESRRNKKDAKQNEAMLQSNEAMVEPNEANEPKERKVKESKEEIHTLNYNHQMREQFPREGIVHEMIGVWEKYISEHTEDENEYPIVLKIAYKIAKDNDWKKDDVTSVKRKEILEIWEKYVRFIQSDGHFCRLQISTIHSQWNGLKQTIAAEKKKREELLQKTTTTTTQPPSQLITHMTDADRNKYIKTKHYVQTDSSLR
jgi:hypothetical protein